LVFLIHTELRCTVNHISDLNIFCLFTYTEDRYTSVVINLILSLNWELSFDTKVDF
jgi:hypothetical protein